MATARIAVGRFVRLLVTLVVGIIVLAIILRLLSANPNNGIVRDIHDAANWLVGPFRNLFSLKGAKATMAVNWGLAAVVYLLVGSIIARFIGAAGTGRIRRRRPWYGRRGGSVGPVAGTR